MSSDKKANRDYQIILKQAEDFHNNPKGISSYQGINQSDKISVKQNNIEILLDCVKKLNIYQNNYIA